MSNIEHEAKVLNVDVEGVRSKLNDLHAAKVGDYNFRRFVFDTIPETPDRWVRLRSNGQETTLTVKEISSDAIDGTEEWEVVVSDFDATLAILGKIGINARGYQENTREEYSLEGAQVAIDHWPKLAPYIEIEAKDTDEVVRVANLLGYSQDELTAKNTKALYSDIGINLQEVAELKFDEE
jgi:Adenylate cyclase, class 2 (thermophilic)